MIKNRGITLIALIITIIILLILAGVTISSLAENGLFQKTKIAKLRLDYESAKEKIEIKLMEVQADCIGHGREYTIVEIAKNIKEDKEITIEKYYNESTALIKTGVTENLVSLEGIVVSVDKYEEYKFLLGESCEIEGVTIEKITDTISPEDFKTPEEFEKEVLGKAPNNNNNGNDNNDDDIVEKPDEPEEQPDEQIKDVPAVGEDVDTTSPIEITTYMSIKNNTKNTLNLSGVENATYTVQEKTGNVSLSENILTANNNAGSTDSCKIQITGTYSGQSYTNNLTVYVEPKNLTTVEDEEGNTLEAFAIYNVEDLIRIRELVDSKANQTFNAKMMVDEIDLADIDWIPIGWESATDIVGFKGIFDGNNKTIKNMEVNIEEDSIKFAGFISNLDNGILKNLKFDNPNVYSETIAASIAVGNAINDSIIENVAILNGTLHSTMTHTGGICGCSDKYSGTEGNIIRNCYNNATITSDSYFIGGICGKNNGSKIENCYNTGSVSTSSYAAGGITGYNFTGGTVEYCYNRGPITATGQTSARYANVGGIAGYNRGTINYTYSSAVITSSATTNGYGLIIGQQLSGGNLYDSYASPYNNRNVVGHELRKII